MIYSFLTLWSWIRHFSSNLTYQSLLLQLPLRTQFLLISTLSPYLLFIYNSLTFFSFSSSFFSHTFFPYCLLSWSFFLAAAPFQTANLMIIASFEESKPLNTLAFSFYKYLHEYYVLSVLRANLFGVHSTAEYIIKHKSRDIKWWQIATYLLLPNAMHLLKLEHSQFVKWYHVTLYIVRVCFKNESHKNIVGNVYGKSI